MAISQNLWKSRGAGCGPESGTQESSLVTVADGRKSKAVGRTGGSKAKSANKASKSKIKHVLVADRLPQVRGRIPILVMTGGGEMEGEGLSKSRLT